MVLIYKLFALGLYINVCLDKAHSYVLLTANVEDIKRIAQKLLSDSLADRIAQIVTDVADKDSDTIFKSIDSLKQGYSSQNKDKVNHPIRHQSGANDAKYDDKGQRKETTSAIKSKFDAMQLDKHNIKKKKPLRNKIKPKIGNSVKKHDSLEYYKTKKHLYKIHPNSIIDIERIEESDDDSSFNIKSRKDFDNINEESDLTEEPQHKIEEVKDKPEEIHDRTEYTEEIQDKTGEYEIDVHKSGDIEAVESLRKDFSNTSNNTGNLDKISGEVSTDKMNQTTVNENGSIQHEKPSNPKAKVVATSGALELTTSATPNSPENPYY